MTHDDAAIGVRFREWIEWRTRGSRDDLWAVFDDIDRERQSGFPWEPALEALSQTGSRKLWKTFDDGELQDLYDWAMEAGLDAVAERLLQAARDAPVLDDRKIPRKIREQVLERAGHRCQVCGTTERLSIDHKIVPWSEGGSSHDPMNLQVLCVRCNSRKGASMGTTVGKSRPA